MPAPKGTERLPAVVVVHGVTDLGVEDGRLTRLALAFRAAGFAAVVPEVEGLVRFGEARDDDTRLLALLRALSAGKVPGVDGSRLGLFGVATWLQWDGYEDGTVTTGGLVFGLLGLVALTAGGWLGGTIVFVHGMRVEAERRTAEDERSRQERGAA